MMYEVHVQLNETNIYAKHVISCSTTRLIRLHTEIIKDFRSRLMHASNATDNQKKKSDEYY